MRIQYISDLHHNFPPITPVADYIALLGDITSPYDPYYKEYLKYLSSMFKGVFVVFGNHEYYNTIMSEVDEYMENICSCLSNVYFLNNKSVVIEGFLIIGSTLWSNVDTEAFDFLNCGKLIKMTKNKYMDLFDYHILFNKAVNFILSELSRELPTIVLTHYAPLHEMNGSKESSLYTGFSSDLSYIQRNIKVWLSGHTHVCKTIRRNNILYSSNCHGYKKENLRFNPCQVIEF